MSEIYAVFATDSDDDIYVRLVRADSADAAIRALDEHRRLCFWLQQRPYLYPSSFVYTLEDVRSLLATMEAGEVDTPEGGTEATA